MTSAKAAPMGYIVSRFPKVTETFIVNEMASVAAHELGIQLFTMVRTDEPALHQATARWMEELNVGERRVVHLVMAQLRWLRRRPFALLGLWGVTLLRHLRSPKLLVKTAYATAVGVCWADRLAAHRHVHVHWATFPAHIAWVAHRLTRLSYSVTAHAHDIQTPNPMMGLKLTSADFVVTISDHNRQHLIREVGADLEQRLHVIRCGVDTGRFVARDQDAVVEPMKFVCVASFMAYKGHSVLLEALAKLRLDGLPASLCLVGDGELRSSIESDIARLGLSDHVELAGWLSADDVAKVVRSAAGFVLASVVLADGQTEGIPVALMEAMASGVPVVATRVSGVPELVVDERTGLLAEAGDVDGLASAMRSIIEDPDAAGLRAERGVIHVREHYDHERNVARLTALFDQRV